MQKNTKKVYVWQVIKSGEITKVHFGCDYGLDTEAANQGHGAATGATMVPSTQTRPYLSCRTNSLWV